MLIRAVTVCGESFWMTKLLCRNYELVARVLQTYRASVQLPDSHCSLADSMASCVTLAVRLPSQELLRAYLEKPEERYAIITRRYGVTIAWDTSLVSVDNSKPTVMQKWCSEAPPVVLHFVWASDGARSNLTPLRRSALTTSGPQAVDELRHAVERSNLQMVTMMRKSIGGGGRFTTSTNLNSPTTITAVSATPRQNMSIRLELFVQETVWRTMTLEDQRYCLASIRQAEKDLVRQLATWNVGQKHPFCLINTRDSYRHELNVVTTKLELQGHRSVLKKGIRCC
jgi:hypothetical protein